MTFNKCVQTPAISITVALAIAPMCGMAQADCDVSIANRMTLTGPDVDCLYRKFNEHFQRDTDEPLRDPEEEVAWSDIEPKLLAVGGVEQGMIIRYGLYDGEVVLGLSFVPFVQEDADTYTFDDVAPVYVLEGTQMAADPITLVEWQRDYVDEAWPLNNGHYFSEVEVKHNTDGGFNWVNRGVDAEYEVIPYNLELKLLLQHNTAEFAANERPYLVFRCISRYDTDQKMYMHRVALFLRMWHANGGKRDLLDNSVIAAPRQLKMHGADLGHLCPPSCRKYVRQQLR